MVLNLPKDKTKTHIQLYAQAKAETNKKRREVLLQQAKSLELSTSMKSYTRGMKMINQQVKDVKNNTTKGDAWKRESLRELGVERKAESQTSKNATIKCTNNKCKVKSITCKSGYKKDPRTMKCIRNSTGQSKPVSKGPKPDQTPIEDQKSKVCALMLLPRPRCVRSHQTGLVYASRKTICQLEGEGSVVPNHTIVNGRCKFNGTDTKHGSNQPGSKQKPCKRDLHPVQRCITKGTGGEVTVSSSNDCVLGNEGYRVSNQHKVMKGICVKKKPDDLYPQWGPTKQR